MIAQLEQVPAWVGWAMLIAGCFLVPLCVALVVEENRVKREDAARRRKGTP